MSYPLIILGAGASHDYVSPTIAPEDFLLPPITDDLVDKKYLDIKISAQYPEAEDLISKIANIVNTKKKSLEESLALINNSIQLEAFKFYLKDFFQKISKSCYNFNNYKALKDEIVNKACIINFNYDNLFENCLGSKNWRDIDDYINGDIKIIKVHGSCDWSYIKQRDINYERINKITNSFDFFKKEPQLFHNHQKIYLDNYIAQNSNLTNYFKFPAIAVPTGSIKKYICPSQHVDILNQALEETDRILIIGWKAGDEYIVDLIKSKATHPINLCVVSGNKNDIDSVFSKFADNKYLLQRVAKCIGFSEFIESNQCKTFFWNKVT